MNGSMMGVMKRYVNPRGTLIFILVATLLMLIIHFMFGYSAPVSDPNEFSQADDPPYFYTQLQYPEAFDEAPSFAEFNETEFEEVIAAYYTAPEEKAAEVIAPKPKGPKKKAPAYEPLKVEGSPKIAIIIDDMGVDRRRSQKVIDIDAPLTLAFLPYVERLDDITERARSHGHELIIHMPMQATTNPVSLGPIALKVGMSEDEVKANMEQAFESFEGYEGLNNHMGSKVTQDSEIMDWVMESLSEKGLFFVDSKTIGSSVGAETARLNGLPTAERDVFLDHENTPEFVAGALRKLERVAADKGYAIAIGHPKDVTINGLLSWIPDAQSRGFEIVHVSYLLERPKRVASAKVSAPSRTAGKAPIKKKVVKAIEETQPAAGEEKAVKFVEPEDPNSAQAREAILKKLLGQAE